jgi:hypothetical protein
LFIKTFRIEGGKKILTRKKLLFFAIVGIVGGLVIGIGAGTTLSPILLGLIGGTILFVVAVILNSLWGEYWFRE